jgi:hypothetical protein
VRLAELPTDLLVSDELKRKIEAGGFTGIIFSPLSTFRAP